MIKPMQKSWLSPFLFITYLATSITGIFMLFHIKFPGLYPVHKWGGPCIRYCRRVSRNNKLENVRILF